MTASQSWKLKDINWIPGIIATNIYWESFLWGWPWTKPFYLDCLILKSGNTTWQRFSVLSALYVGTNWGVKRLSGQPKRPQLVSSGAGRWPTWCDTWALTHVLLTCPGGSLQKEGERQTRSRFWEGQALGPFPCPQSELFCFHLFYKLVFQVYFTLRVFCF